MGLTYDINKPWLTLDPWQKEYIETKGNCFLLCGRQVGKTAAMSIKFGKRAATTPNRVVLMLAYTEKQAYNLFFKTLMYLMAVYPKKVKRGADKPTKHQIKLTNGSIIMCYAAGLTGEGVRTYTVTDLVIDEAAPMKREVFVATTPMLSVTKGSLDISSTPRGKEGYFYECSLKDNFTKFYISAEECPRHDKEFLEEEKKTMSDLEYAQEYKAEFLSNLLQFFPEELIEELCDQKRRDSIMPARDYFYGADVARKGKDEFTHEILERKDNGNLIHVENIMTKNVPIPENVRKIIELNLQYNFKKEYIDSGGMGITVCDLLRENSANKHKVVEINNASRPIDRDETQHKKILKEDLYNNLLSLMQQRRIRFLSDEEVKASLRSIQCGFEEGVLKIWGSYSHITEGLIRAAWCIKDKSLNLWVRWS